MVSRARNYSASEMPDQDSARQPFNSGCERCSGAEESMRTIRSQNGSIEEFARAYQPLTKLSQGSSAWKLSWRNHSTVLRSPSSNEISGFHPVANRNLLISASRCIT